MQFHFSLANGAQARRFSVQNGRKSPLERGTQFGGMQGLKIGIRPNDATQTLTVANVSQRTDWVIDTRLQWHILRETDWLPPRLMKAVKPLESWCSRCAQFFHCLLQALCSHRHVVLNCRSIAMSKDPSRPGCWLLPHSYIQMEKMNKLAPNLFYEMLDMKCKSKYPIAHSSSVLIMDLLSVTL